MTRFHDFEELSGTRKKQGIALRLQDDPEGIALA